MTRTDAIVKIDEAASALEEALAILSSLGSTFSLDNRIENVINSLDILRVDVLQADLLCEWEI